MIIECLERSFAVVTLLHMGSDIVKRGTAQVADRKGLQLINPRTEKRCHRFFPPRRRSTRRSSHTILTESRYTMLINHIRTVDDRRATCRSRKRVRYSQP